MRLCAVCWVPQFHTYSDTQARKELYDGAYVWLVDWQAAKQYAALRTRGGTMG